MKPDEARDVGSVSGAAMRAVTELVRGGHQAVSDTVYGILAATLGPWVAPIRVAQDAITSGVYAATGLALDGGARLAGTFVAQRLRARGDELASVHDGAAHHALAVGLGLYGDRWVTDAASIAPAMHVRRHGRWVPLTADGVAAAYDRVTPAIAVFLHGLFETEAAWRLGTGRRPTYAARLEENLGLTPVLVRFNTGLRISENGIALGSLLTDLVASWPVPVERVVLLGHSMGGLVIHSALAAASRDDGTEPGWLPLVTDTVTLGSPHHGSPVARTVHRATELAAGGPRTQFLADILRRRSVGIRDLSHGNVVPADWKGHDPVDPVDRRTHPDPRASIRHHAVVAVASARLPPRVAEVVGDLLVPVASAAHAELATVTRRFTEDGVAVVRGVHHLGLLNDDEVYGHLARWLATAAAHQG